MILVVSHAGDDHATAVLSALGGMGYPATLLDTAAFPSRARLTQRFHNGSRRFEFTEDDRGAIDLSSCRAAWWRRPQPYTLPEGVAPDAVTFAYTECHEAFSGLFAALDVVWVNPPELDEVAHHKPFQLAIASKVGLPIPRTVITNDPDEARGLVGELGAARTVYKTFLATESAWRETRTVKPQELGLLDTVRVAPVIFQEFVPAASDIRITVVGETLFATAITPAPGGYELDYRVDLEGAQFAPTELPAETAEKIRALMDRLGLLYGAIDMRKTPDGRFVFLEVNPAGEWRFVEERTRQPITRAMAELLARLDREGRPP